MTTESKHVPKKRNGYYYFNGKEYVSVTKVIQDVLAKPALLYWYGNKSAQIALKNPVLNEKEVMAELQLYTRQTQERGHYIHTLAENMPNIEPWIDPTKQDCDGYIQALRAFWSTHSPKILGGEIELYTDTYGVAGRCDQVIEINGQTWVIDYKTGKEIYKEVELQLAIYKFMLEELKVVSVGNMGVVLLKSDGAFVFERKVGKVEDFINVLNVWKWLQTK